MDIVNGYYELIPFPPLTEGGTYFSISEDCSATSIDDKKSLLPYPRIVYHVQ